MKIRIRADLILEPTDTTTRNEISTTFDKIKVKLQRITELETSSIIVEKCYHDENKPCEVIESWKFEG